MNTAIDNKNMNFNTQGTFLLLSSYVLNIGAFISDISPIVKGFFVVLTTLTTMMAFLNQYKTFQKNFKTFYVVVIINRVFTYMKPKKNRHRGIKITKAKPE